MFQRILCPPTNSYFEDSLHEENKSEVVLLKKFNEKCGLKLHVSPRAMQPLVHNSFSLK
jgi:hypothetical protein